MSTDTLGGFPALRLANDLIEAWFIPELGGRLASLRVKNGREWCHHPGGSLKLWANQPGDAFSTSTCVGLDECLPTISACHVDGRDLPDHGSCWNHPWEVLPGPGIGPINEYGLTRRYCKGLHINSEHHFKTRCYKTRK